MHPSVALTLAQLLITTPAPHAPEARPVVERRVQVQATVTEIPEPMAPIGVIQPQVVVIAVEPARPDPVNHISFQIGLDAYSETLERTQSGHNGVLPTWNLGFARETEKSRHYVSLRGRHHSGAPDGTLDFEQILDRDGVATVDLRYAYMHRLFRFGARFDVFAGVSTELGGAFGDLPQGNESLLTHAELSPRVEAQLRVGSRHQFTAGFEMPLITFQKALFNDESGQWGSLDRMVVVRLDLNYRMHFGRSFFVAARYGFEFQHITDPVETIATQHEFSAGAGLSF